MADRLAIPRRLYLLRMPVGEEDAAHPLVALPDHVDDLRGLDDVERLRGPRQLTRCASRPAARLRQERNADLAGQQLLVRLAHLLSRPRFENRILVVAERGRWPAGLVAAQRIVGMLLDRPAHAGR